MKIDKNFWIPIVVVLAVFSLFFLTGEAPLSVLVLTFIFVLCLMLMFKKNNYDWGIMFTKGIIASVIFVALLVVIFVLSKNNELLDRIIQWPLKP